jgi:hypothetical protein
MTNITYGVKVTAISKRNAPAQEFLFRLVEDGVEISKEERDNEFWEEEAGTVLFYAIEDGEIPECDPDSEISVVDDWTFTVSYGLFSCEIDQELSDTIDDVDDMLAELFSVTYH